MNIKNFKLINILIILTSMLLMINFSESTDARAASKNILTRTDNTTLNGSMLSVDQAFTLTASFINANTIQLTWHIAAKTQLYKNKIKILTGQNFKSVLSNGMFPAINLHREKIAHHPVYTKELTMQISWPQNQQQYGLLISYHGCSTRGFCYTPIYKELKVKDGQILLQNYNGDKAVFKNGYKNMQGTATATPKAKQAAIKSSKINKFLTHLTTHSTPITLLLFFLFGILLTFTPCTLPLLPITLNIILGSESKTNPYRSTMILSIYILSMAFCYTSVGIATAMLGTTMQVFLQTPWVIVVTCCLLALFGLLQFEVLPHAFSRKIMAKLHLTHNVKTSGNVLGAITMGIASALTLTPCATPALIGILIYISQTGNPWLGGATLFCLSIGMGMPLLAISIIGHHILPKAGHWLNTVKHATGLTLFGIIIWLLARILPAKIITALWAILCLGTAVYLGVFKFKMPKKTWQWLNKLLAYALMLTGIFLLLSMSNCTVLPVLHNTKAEINYNDALKAINNKEELTKALKKAKRTGKPVVLFFHADWCTYCKELSKTFYQLYKTKETARLIMLQVDVTTQNQDELSLMKKYKVLGLPAVLFFTPKGIELTAARLSEPLTVVEMKRYISELF